MRITSKISGRIPRFHMNVFLKVSLEEQLEEVLKRPFEYSMNEFLNNKSVDESSRNL